MSDIDFLLDQTNPSLIARKIADNVKNLRISRNLTQEELAEHSGVTLSTLKRFEQRAEISLRYLLMLAIALNATDNFDALFSVQSYDNIDDFLKDNEEKKRQRVRK